MKVIYLLTICLLAYSCEETIHYPNKNAYRDSVLVGTWYSNDSIIVLANGDILRRFYVYEQSGYYGQVLGSGETKFENLGFIWEVSKTNESNNWKYNQIHEYHVYENWKKKVLDRHYFYDISEFKDTLILYSLDNIPYDTLYKYPSYQLIYDDYVYAGIDSIMR